MYGKASLKGAWSGSGDPL